MKENSIATVFTSTRSFCLTYVSTGIPSRPITTAAIPPSTLSTTLLSVSANTVLQRYRRLAEPRHSSAWLLRRDDGGTDHDIAAGAAGDEAVLELVARVRHVDDGAADRQRARA